MSAVDDFAEIARRLREKQGLPKPKPVAEPQPVADFDNLPGIQPADPGHSHQYSNRPWGQGQQAQQAVQGMPPCSLCDDEGWIGVKRRGLWAGLQCPMCGNPRHKKNPI